jgi:hypothetical protein
MIRSTLTDRCSNSREFLGERTRPFVIYSVADRRPLPAWDFILLMADEVLPFSQCPPAKSHAPFAITSQLKEELWNAATFAIPSHYCDSSWSIRRAPDNWGGRAELRGAHLAFQSGQSAAGEVPDSAVGVS